MHLNWCETQGQCICTNTHTYACTHTRTHARSRTHTSTGKACQNIFGKNRRRATARQRHLALAWWKHHHKMACNVAKFRVTPPHWIRSRDTRMKQRALSAPAAHAHAHQNPVTSATTPSARGRVRCARRTHRGPFVWAVRDHWRLERCRRTNRTRPVNAGR